MQDKQFLYIIGAPRSGTTMLQILLGSHPQVATTVELTLFNRYVAPWLETWRTETANARERGWKQGLPMLWSEAEFEEHVREFLRRAYGKVIERFPERTHVLDKCPGYGLHVDAIKRFVPNARFIHIIRDGRDVASSLVAAQATMGFGVTRFAEGGVLWKMMVRGAREAAKFGAEYLELRYESFLKEQVSAYARVLEFCGLACDRAWVARTLEENSFERMKERQATADPNVTVSTHHYRKGEPGAWQAEYSLRDRFEFEQAAGDLLRELGYAQDGWWATTARDRRLEPLRHEGRRRWRHLAQALKYTRAAIFGATPAAAAAKSKSATGSR